MKRATFTHLVQSITPCRCDDDATANGHGATCPYGKVVARLWEHDAQLRAEVRRLREEAEQKDAALRDMLKHAKMFWPAWEDSLQCANAEAALAPKRGKR